MSGEALLNFLVALFGYGLVVIAAFGIALDLGPFTDGAIPTPYWWVLSLWALAAVVFAVVRGNMIVYVAKRLVEAGLVLLIIATLTFLMLRFLPGGPFDSEKALPKEVKANIEAKYGLNLPLTRQYENYIVGVLHGDLGESYKYIGRPVSEIIGETLPVSFQLGFYSLLLAFALGVPLGVIASAWHNTYLDRALMLFAIGGVALPSFIVGPLLVMIFSFGVPFSFLHGALPPALWESPIYYVMPVLTLGLRPAAVIARMTRASMLDVIQADFVRTARAKGVSRTNVLFKHVLKNALVPVLTIAGPLIAGVLSGSFIVEIVFGIPGMGKHLVQSVTNRDYPLILGMTLVFSVLLVLANLAVDLLYTVVDPRIRL